MKKIKKSIEISASKEKVWSVLLEDAYTRMWYAEFSEGSHAETDWIEGHKVKFTDNSGCGIIGRVTEKRPYEKILITYDGMIQDGVEDYDSYFGKAVKGSIESYALSEENGVTRLDVECDMDDSVYDMMSNKWDKALLKIETLSLT